MFFRKEENIMSSAIGGISTGYSSAADQNSAVINPGQNETKEPGRRSSPAECQTCKNRKYPGR